MREFLGAVWFFSYMTTWLMFAYWGWLWSHEIATAQATFVWFVLSLGLGALGVWVVVRLNSLR